MMCIKISQQLCVAAGTVLSPCYFLCSWRGKCEFQWKSMRYLQEQGVANCRLWAKSCRRRFWWGSRAKNSFTFFNWSVKKIQIIFWDMRKLYEIQISESLNKAMLEHGHAHLFFYCLLSLQWAVATKIVWSAKTKLFTIWLFTKKIFSSLLEDTLQGFLILILWEIFYKPCGYNW